MWVGLWAVNGGTRLAVKKSIGHLLGKVIIIMIKQWFSQTSAAGHTGGAV